MIKYVSQFRPLPHSIDEDSREVCLFVKDLDKNDREYEKTVDHYQTLFKAKGVTKITKVGPHACVAVTRS